MPLTYDPEAAVAHLRSADAKLARLIAEIGPFTMEPRDGSFRTLGRAIFFQQLAGPAARAILNRVLAALGTDENRWYTPEKFLAATDEQLRAAGVSRQKLVYLRDLAERFASGELSEDDFHHLDDEAVIERASSVKIRRRMPPMSYSSWSVTISASTVCVICSLISCRVLQAK